MFPEIPQRSEFPLKTRILAFQRFLLRKIAIEDFEETFRGLKIMNVSGPTLKNDDSSQAYTIEAIGPNNFPKLRSIYSFEKTENSWELMNDPTNFFWVENIEQIGELMTKFKNPLAQKEQWHSLDIEDGCLHLETAIVF